MINLFGLTIGLTSVILIMLFVVDEFSYDRFHTKADRIYRVVENQYYAGQPVFPVAVTPGPLGPSLAAEYADVEKATRFDMTSVYFKKGNERFRETGAYVDTTFLDIFSFEIIKGDLATALNEIDNVVLTEELSRRLFSDEEAIGQLIKVNDDREARVSAIIKNLPENSHLQFDFLMPFENMASRIPEINTNWGNNTLYTYVLLKKETPIEALNKQLINQIKKNQAASITDIYLQPLTDIHLGSVRFTADVGGKGNMQYVSIFLIVAIFILIIACINFMNLATARSMSRSKEVGLRKAIGANRSQLILQFLSESVLTAIVAMALAVLLVDLLLPQFNLLSGKNLALDFLVNYSIISYLLGFAILTGLIAGSYPAFFLSAFQPASVLKTMAIKNSGGSVFRKVLVVAQFSISIIMIVGTIVVYSQIQFIRAKNLGYEKENVVKIPRISKEYPSFKNELLSQSGILSVSGTNQHPAYVENSTSGIDWEGKDQDNVTLIHVQGVDFDYIETMGMKVIEGRSFAKDRPTDSSSVVINQQALELMRFAEPLGQKLNVGAPQPFTVIGVVEDFHFKSIHQQIEPLILFIGRGVNELSYTMVRIGDGDPSTRISAIESVWKKFNPGSEFVYTFLDDDFNELYQAEEQTGTIFKYFSGLAILISCLGLFGLASFTLEQRTKEFGVRKIFGASMFQLFSAASIGFVTLVFIAFVISIPIASYFINQWLDGFAYHVSLGYQSFLWSGLIAIGVALATVSYQSAKSAVANPVNSLRHE